MALVALASTAVCVTVALVALNFLPIGREKRDERASRRAEPQAAPAVEKARGQ